PHWLTPVSSVPARRRRSATANGLTRPSKPEQFGFVGNIGYAEKNECDYREPQGSCFIRHRCRELTASATLARAHMLLSTCLPRPDKSTGRYSRWGPPATATRHMAASPHLLETHCLSRRKPSPKTACLMPL